LYVNTELIGTDGGGLEYTGGGLADAGGRLAGTDVQLVNKIMIKHIILFMFDLPPRTIDN
jgi:hypothetical protein